MKRILLGVLLLTVATTLWAAGGVESEVRARGAEFKAAWDRDDAHAIASLWAEDGDLINPFGRVAKGRAQVEQLFQDEHSTIMKGTKYNITAETVREIDPDSAIADWDVDLEGMRGPQGALPPLKHHVTVVWVKKNGQWWVAAARPVVYQQPPGGGNGM